MRATTLYQGQPTEVEILGPIKNWATSCQGFTLDRDGGWRGEYLLLDAGEVACQLDSGHYIARHRERLFNLKTGNDTLLYRFFVQLGRVGELAAR